ncbi:MAG: response regulator [Pirellulales bacterium]
MDSRVQTAQSSTVWGMRGLYARVEEVLGNGVGQTDWSFGGRANVARQPTSDSRLIRQNSKALRILLVDDTFFVRRLVELILKHQGHHVVSVADGGQAVELALDPTFDVILMDLQMPVMNGWQATAAIRRQEQTLGRSRPVPIIALTAYTVPGNRERSLEAGMNDFLPKPIDAERLIETVELHGRRENEAH